jgi:hypothetical protein
MVHNLLSILDFEGLRSDLPAWKKCGRILFLSIVIPFGLLFLLAEWVSWQAGDWLSMHQAAALQTAKPDLIWYKSRVETYARFKLARVAIDRPDVLIFGPSRCEAFRSAMFRPYTAYNLSYTCYLMHAYTDLLHNLPAGYNPKVIIMSCDYYLFSPVCTAMETERRALQEFTPSWTEKLDELRDVFLELPKNPSLLLIGFHQRHAYPTLGLTAYLGKGGFRKDGSIKLDAPENDDPARFKAPPEANFGDRMGTSEMTQFEEFVSEVHARGIALVCVQLPFYMGEKFVGELAHKPGFGEFQDFNNHVKNGYFDRLNVPFFNFLDVPDYTDKAGDFDDTVHPREAGVLAVVSAMASDSRFLALLPKLDVAAIKEKLGQDQHSQSHNDLYPNEF